MDIQWNDGTATEGYGYTPALPNVKPLTIWDIPCPFWSTPTGNIWECTDWEWWVFTMDPWGRMQTPNVQPLARQAIPTWQPYAIWDIRINTALQPNDEVWEAISDAVSLQQYEESSWDSELPLSSFDWAGPSASDAPILDEVMTAELQDASEDTSWWETASSNDTWGTSDDYGYYSSDAFKTQSSQSSIYSIISSFFSWIYDSISSLWE